MVSDIPTTLRTTKTPYCDSQGRVIGIFGISRDITHRESDDSPLQITTARTERSQRLVHRASGSWEGGTRVYHDVPPRNDEAIYTGENSIDIGNRKLTAPHRGELTTRVTADKKQPSHSPSGAVFLESVATTSNAIHTYAVEGLHDRAAPEARLHAAVWS